MKSIDRKLPQTEYISQPDDSIIICRCEEITKGEIRRAVYDGMRTMNEIRRYLRVGMGLCQGQNCSRIARNIVAKELGVSPGEIEMPVSRAPARPIPMEIYANDGIK